MSEKQSYNHLQAILAIARASLRSITRSPSAVVFSLLFPLIFIVVFGFIGGGGISLDVGLAKGCDTINPLVQRLQGENSGVRLVRAEDTPTMDEDLLKGRFDALLNVTKTGNTEPPFYNVQLTLSAASMRNGRIFQTQLTMMMNQINSAGNIPKDLVLKMDPPKIVEGRPYKSIDFILPGQLGFSILASGVFGTAFVFLSLRQTLVLKRFFATPVRRSDIILGETLSRVTFSIAGSAIIILIGKFAFGFTLIHGFVTVINMLLLSVLGLVVFMGFGFVVSGVAKNESSVPPIANLITMPQFLLSGTFFSIQNFPSWLQPISKALPLTYLNDALRKIAFEGAGLFDVGHQILIVSLWGIGVYIIAIKVFRWE